MSIRINKDECIGCGKCQQVCPGSLIKIGDDNKAYIKYPKDCWGCTSCIKECPVDALRFYLGADIGGKGSSLYTQKRGDILKWIVVKFDGSRIITDINTKESNKY